MAGADFGMKIIHWNKHLTRRFVILSEAKDLCTLPAAAKMHRSFAAKDPLRMTPFEHLVRAIG